MIHALGHICVTTGSLTSAAAEYELLLGRRPQPTDAGNERVTFGVENMQLYLQASSDGTAGLSAIGFAVADLSKARRLLQRRGLELADGHGRSTAQIAPEGTHGVHCTIAERSSEATAPAAPAAMLGSDDAVSGLDHVVIRTPDPERAIALYAGRLGLSLRLDRSAPEWGARLLFFRCGDLVVEVAHNLNEGTGPGADRLWGLSWRVPDVARAHTRLRAAGVVLSDLRNGRRPHTKVFTVKSHTAGVPTLMIGPSAQ